VPVKEDEAAAATRLDGLLDALGLGWQDCIRASYIDLVLESAALRRDQDEAGERKREP